MISVHIDSSQKPLYAYSTSFVLHAEISIQLLPGDRGRKDYAYFTPIYGHEPG